jgi:hypothetical protein
MTDRNLAKRILQAQAEAIKDEIYFRGYGKVQDCLITVVRNKKKKLLSTEGAD